MDNIYNYEGALKKTLERIKNSKSINKDNKKIILEFKNHLKSINMSDATVNRNLFSLIKLDSLLKKSFKKASKSDIKSIVAKLNERQPRGNLLGEESKKKIKMHIRTLYKFIAGIDEKGVYPEKVKWISIAMPKSHRKLPEDLLTGEEINLLIRYCKTPRDKAFIATLADSGCRISEVGTMKIKHISFGEGGIAKLTVNGKTGMRKILVVSCIPYLQTWLNIHPENVNPDSYLWPGADNSPLCYARLAAILKQAIKDAGIIKRVHPHLFRHSRATALAPRMSEACMKSYFGWGQDSKMCGIYIHMSGEATDEAILRAHGMEVKKEEIKIPMQPRKCLRCTTINEVTNNFCKLCGLPLTEEEAQKIIRVDLKKQKAEEWLNMLVKDPDILELIKKKIEV